MAYKRYLTAKTKNLFDVSKIVAGSNITIKSGVITCSDYGISIGQVKTLCPSLQVGNTVKILLKGTFTSNKYSGYSGCFIMLGGAIRVSGESVTITQETLDSTVYLYNAANVETAGKYPDSKGIYYNITITKDLNQSETIPYGYLPSYKSKLKIAKVNQLLDKSKFPATATVSGVTITNNNNGSFTFTGGVTTTGAIGYLGIIDHYPLKKGHRYICPIQELKIGDTSSYVELVITKSDGNSTWTNDYLVEEDGMICRVGCLKYGTDTTPHTVKPILVDLTEMYGPQHMPTDAMAFFANYPTQVLDKAKFSPGQTTINGITITNNGDGTFLVAGTATDTVFFSVDGNSPGVVSGHTYLMRGCPANGSVGTYAMYIYHTNASAIAWDFGNGVIYTAGAGSDPNPMIRVEKGTECNVMYKPEFVDLTALGLDSTITSPEQFNPKVDYIPFVYDYAPKCWLTSYKHNLIATTKNLLSYSETTAEFPETDWENTNPRDLSEGVWYVATSANNYSIKATVTDYKIERNLLYINVAQAAYGLSRAFKCNPGEVYTLSVRGKGNIQLGVGFFDMSGNYLSYTNRDANLLSFTTPTNCKWFWVNFAASQDNSKIYFRDIQLEKGNAATSRIPNGYV